MAKFNKKVLWIPVAVAVGMTGYVGWIYWSGSRPNKVPNPPKIPQTPTSKISTVQAKLGPVERICFDCFNLNAAYEWLEMGLPCHKTKCPGAMYGIKTDNMLALQSKLFEEGESNEIPALQRTRENADGVLTDVYAVLCDTCGTKDHYRHPYVRSTPHREAPKTASINPIFPKSP